MKKESIKFTNTRRNKKLRSFLYVFMAIMLVEMFAVVIILYNVVDNAIIFYSISAIILFLELGLILMFFTTLLYSSHILMNDFIIRLGTRLKVRLSLDNIESVELVQEHRYPKDDDLGLVAGRKGDYLYCLGSKENVVLVRLKQGIVVKSRDMDSKKSSKGFIKGIYLNIDDEADFLRAFSLFTSDSLNQSAIVISKKIIMTAESENSLPNNCGLGVTGENSILMIKDLSYNYDQFKAVDKLALAVRAGEIFAFLGPNGAGKSTTIKMLTGLLKPKSGQILVNNVDIWSKHGAEVRRQIGYVPDQPILYRRLTAREQLYYSGKLLGLSDDTLEKRVDDWLERLNLVDFQNQMIETYSQGMQRKVSLALALLPDPDILIVDELTNAFDAMTLAMIKQIFYQRKSIGKAVFFSGHVMSVAEELSDRIAIIQHGKCCLCGTMEELRLTYGQNSSLEEIFLNLANFQEVDHG